MPTTPPNRTDPRWTISEIAETLSRHKPRTQPSSRLDRNAAVAMILREEAGSVDALFIKRAEHEGDPWSGHMAFPGGHRDESDLSLEGAATRETREEVGVELDEGMRLGRLHDLSGGRLRQRALSVSAFVYHHPSPPELTLNHEVADTIWVPLDYMGDPANTEPYYFPQDPRAREFPSIQYEGYTIWGLTYRILANYFAVFGITLPGEPEISDVE